MKTSELDLRLSKTTDFINIIVKKQVSERCVQNDSIHKMFKNMKNKIIQSGNVHIHKRIKGMTTYLEECLALLKRRKGQGAWVA